MNRNKLARYILKVLCESYRNNNCKEFEEDFLTKHFCEHDDKSFNAAAYHLEDNGLIETKSFDDRVYEIDLSKELVNRLEENKFVSATKDIYEFIKTIAPFL